MTHSSSPSSSKTEVRPSSALVATSNVAHVGSRVHRKCKRPGCGMTTPRGVCLPCWGQLSKRTRSDVVRSASRLTTTPEDEQAQRLNSIAWGIALREWSEQECP